MLLSTGFRLVAPQEFIHVYRVGSAQLRSFSSTILGALATDLRVGIGIGIVVKAIVNSFYGAPPGSLSKPSIAEESAGEVATIRVDRSAVFSTWARRKSG